MNLRQGRVYVWCVCVCVCPRVSALTSWRMNTHRFSPVGPPQYRAGVSRRNYGYFPFSQEDNFLRPMLPATRSNIFGATRRSEDEIIQPSRVCVDGLLTQVHPWGSRECGPLNSLTSSTWRCLWWATNFDQELTTSTSTRVRLAWVWTHYTMCQQALHAHSHTPPRLRVCGETVEKPRAGEIASCRACVSTKRDSLTLEKKRHSNRGSSQGYASAHRREGEERNGREARRAESKSTGGVVKCKGCGPKTSASRPGTEDQRWEGHVSPLNPFKGRRTISSRPGTDGAESLISVNRDSLTLGGSSFAYSWRFRSPSY